MYIFEFFSQNANGIDGVFDFQRLLIGLFAKKMGVYGYSAVLFPIFIKMYFAFSFLNI